MRHSLQSILFSLRLSVKTPTNTTLCIFVLAGCIMLVTSMFRLCYITYLSKAPYKDSDRMVFLERISKRGERLDNWSFQTMDLIENRKDSVFNELIPYYGDHRPIYYGNESFYAETAHIYWDFERILGIHPILGRTFNESDARADCERTAIISETIWRQWFNASPDVLGKVITVGKTERVIVGVMPELFEFPYTCKIWIPLNRDVLKNETGWVREVDLVGVIRKDLSYKEARARFSIQYKQIAEATPDDNGMTSDASMRRLNFGDMVDKGTLTVCNVMILFSLLVMFMGCGIVSGLLTTKCYARSQELAVRSALGATKMQLVVMVMADFALIAFFSLVLGLLASRWFENTFTAQFYANANVPLYVMNISLPWIFAFVAAIFCLITLCSALVPAIRASNTDINATLRESSRTGSSRRVTRLSNALIVWMVATAVVVLCGVSIVGFKLYELHHGDRYYDPDQFACAWLSFNKKDHPDAKKWEIGRKIMARLEASPVVEKVGLTNEIFGREQWGAMDQRIWVEGVDYEDDRDLPPFLVRLVSPGYFKTMGIPLMAGRDFTYADDSSRPTVAIVTDVFARKNYGTTDVVGKTFKLWSKEGMLCMIVGVCPDIYNSRQDPRLNTGVILPYAALPWDDIAIFIKCKGCNMAETEKLLRDAIRAEDDKVIVVEQMSMTDMRDQHGIGLVFEFFFQIFSIFAFCAVVLMAAGLYGVISLSVGLKRRESGIRLALGETPEHLVYLLVRRGLICVGIGFAIGVLLALAMRHAMFVQFSTLNDSWLAYSICGLVLVVISVVAVLVPAIQGAVSDPAQVLRNE